MNIRDYTAADAAALRAVFTSAIHEGAASHYSAEQLTAWAPKQYPESDWAARMNELQPFVAEEKGEIIGYADLQPSGYIDHFFVSGQHSRRGVGAALMNHIHQIANQRGIEELLSDVSLAAEGFFSQFGFKVVARQTVLVRGVALDNARMRKPLGGDRECSSTPGLMGRTEVDDED